MQLSIIAAIFVAIAGVVFAMQNNVPVTVNFLLWRFDSSLAMVLLLAVALGAIVVALLTTPSTLRRQWTASRQRKRIEELERHCAKQARRIVELERAAGPDALAPEKEQPYVGLKQIIAGSGDRPADAEPPKE